MYDIKLFSFLDGYYEAILTMKQRDREIFSFAILQFMFEGIEPNFKGNMLTCWSLIKPNLLKSKNKSVRKK